MTYFNLENKVALVTGASSGLGKHFAKLLAKQGAKVVLGARRKEKLDTVVSEIIDAGGTAMSVVLDVTDPQSISAAFDYIFSHYGVVQVLSNNAGISDSTSALSTTEESWNSVLETNLTGGWRMAISMAKQCVENNVSGSIVNTASILGLRVSMGQSSYATSKAALIQLTRSLALELSRKKIRANALCPGYFLTELNEDYFQTDKGKQYIQSMPSQRLGQLNELDVPFLLLACEQAGSYMNGSVLVVDAGHSISNM
ncbi:MAG: NAD(P)-dependent dehydrogenase (short-subunit alcohol dehydrogenase family) [Francisellaceae bacterium]|jgi:NAD(P)-dependent dehydrogenase (short-subunit alcohol dehydrogenase family)